MAEPRDSFVVRRSVTIAASAEHIFSFIVDFHRWAEWSPFDKLDPNLRRTYGGPERGVGASYAWDGRGRAGAGRMEIVEAAEPSRVSIRLDFTKPFKGTNRAEFTLDSRAGAVTVTWAMTGAHTLMSKAMGLFISMDKMIGKDFEEGLASLKRLAEAAA